MTSPRNLSIQIISPAYNIATRYDFFDVLEQVRSWHDLKVSITCPDRQNFDLLSVEVNFQTDPSDILGSSENDSNASGLLYALQALARNKTSYVEWELCGIGLEQHHQNSEYLKQLGILLVLSGTTPNEINPDSLMNNMIEYPSNQASTNSAITRLLPKWRTQFVSNLANGSSIVTEVESVIQNYSIKTEFTLANSDLALTGIYLKSIFADLISKAKNNPTFYSNDQLNDDVLTWLKGLRKASAQTYLIKDIVNKIRAEYCDENGEVNYYSFYNNGTTYFSIDTDRKVGRQGLCIILFAYLFWKKHGTMPSLSEFAQPFRGLGTTDVGTQYINKAFNRTAVSMQFIYATPSRMFKFIVNKKTHGKEEFHPDYEEHWSFWVESFLDEWEASE